MLLEEAKALPARRRHDEQLICDTLDGYTLTGAANILSRIAEGTAAILEEDDAAPELVWAWTVAAKALATAASLEWDGSPAIPSQFSDPITPTR